MMRWLWLFLVLSLPALAQPVGAPGGGAYATLIVPNTGAIIQGVGPCSGTVTVTPPSTTTGALTCSTTTNISPNTQIATIVVNPAWWTGLASITAATGSFTTSSFVIAGSSPNYTINVGSTPLAPSSTPLTGNLQGTISP